MRSLRVLAALTLAATATLSTSPARAADPTGTLTVNLVDASGAPAVGQLQILDADGGPVGSGGVGSSTVTVELPAGAYGAMGVTPWGGFTCAGLDGCSYIEFVSGQVRPNGDVAVTPGGHTTVTIRPDAPATLSGSRTVGDPLEVAFSSSLTEFYTILGGGGLGVAPSVEWLRDGTPIGGASELTYVPTAADSGKALRARLVYSGVALSYLRQLAGSEEIPPYTTAPVTVRKRSSQTFIRLARSTITAGQHGVARVDVTSPGKLATGTVTVAVDDWQVTRVIRNGRAVVRLPILAPGGHTVTAAYRGTGEYAASKAEPKKLTVRRG